MNCRLVLCVIDACVNLSSLQALGKFSLCKHDPIAFYMMGLSIFKFVSLQVVAKDIRF